MTTGPNRTTTSSADVPVASAAWAVEQVLGELRESYLSVAAAGALVERIGAGCPHPALRQARQWGRAAEELVLMAASLGAAVGALSSYTGGLSGAGTATT